MKPFEYLMPENVEAALAACAGGAATVKAGGVDLVDLMKEGVETPSTVLSLSGVPALRHITPEGPGVWIGCLTTLADIQRSDFLRARFPGFWEAVAGAATPQVREQATLGGNLCQRPRCWYFRNAEFPCLKKNGSSCFAWNGENEHHAIFAGGPCHIVHPSNAAPPLLAAGAEFRVRSQTREVTIRSGDFFVTPKQSLLKENVLEPGDVLTDIHVPVLPAQSATVELRQKQSFDWPLASASVARVNGTWRVCLGAVAPVPWLSEGAMAVLGDREVSRDLAEQAGAAAAEGAKPLSQNAYKVNLVGVAVKRALLAAAGTEVS